MNAYLMIFICVLLWGTCNFLNKLAVETMPPMILQALIGIGYSISVPLFFAAQGVNPLTYKLSYLSIAIVFIATVFSIGGNVLLYAGLKGNEHTGSSAMLISLYPVITLILSYVFLHEQFSTMKIIGVLSIIGGTIFLSV
jgi:drug/metabolite transporter (DMT)-like permease